MITLGAIRDTDPLFWDKVSVAPNGCWLWQGRRDRHGYGQVKRRSISNTPLIATRYAWMLANKRKMRRNYVALHTCDNPQCVNPNHLQERTQRTNMLDMHAKGRHVIRKGKVVRFNITKQTSERL